MALALLWPMGFYEWFVRQVPQRMTRRQLIAARAAASSVKPSGKSSTSAGTDDDIASQSSMSESEGSTGDADRASASTSERLLRSTIPFLSLVHGATGKDSLSVESSESLTTFDASVKVFKKALAHYNKALETFVLDGYVSDHCALLSLASKLYKYVRGP